MSARFVDTNVLLYAISSHPLERAKAESANKLLEDGGLVLSAQVLQEFFVQTTRETREDALTHEQAVGLLESFPRFPVVETTTAIVLAAATTCERFRISYWDAAILEAARSFGCEVVLSEDLDDDTDYAGVRVVNPFTP